jgi:cytochrome P450
MQIEAVSTGDFGGSGDRLDLDALPGPASTPILGAFGNLARFFADPIGYTDQLANGGYGEAVIFARGMRRGILWGKEAPAAVFLFGPQYMQQLLTKHATFPESVLARVPSEWGSAARLTSGLLWMHGEPHRQHRRLIMPLFHHKRVQSYRDLMVSGIGNMLDRFEPGESIDIMAEASRLLIEFQNEAVLGLRDMGGELAGLGEQMVEFFCLLGHPGVHLFPLNLPLTPRRRILNLGNRVSTGLDALVAVKLAAKLAASDEGSDVLSMLIRGRTEDGQPLSVDELVSETGHLFVAGWVSTRSAIAFTALLIAQHPEVAADLHDELTSVLHGDAPTIEQLAKLPLLDRVIKESMRLLPPVPLVSRATTQPVQLGGYRLPPRTEFYLSIYHAHRQPDLFPEPRRFRPDRWSTIESSQYSYLPFGIGSRTCPGMAMANLQLRILFAMLLQRYRLEMPRRSKMDGTGIGVMTPRPDVRLRVLKQDRQFAHSRGEVRGSLARMVDFT